MVRRAKRLVWAGVVAAAVGATWLPLAAPAQADDDGWVVNGNVADDDANFLAKLRREGVVIPLPTGALIQDGHLICSHLRRGVEPGEEATRYFPTVGMPQLIMAAQAELCPDTLS
jgi:hypothetical protein